MERIGDPEKAFNRLGDAEKAFNLLGRGCTYDQFLRELVVNAMQHGHAKNIYVTQSEQDKEKICVHDDGIGIANLEGSTALFVKSGASNFGIGGKIASLKRSPLGVEYQTACSGVKSGYLLTIRPLSASHVLSPTFKGAHGTSVTLHGLTPDDSTIRLPGQDSQGGRWIAQYLNRRFFTLPAGVTLKTQRIDDPSHYITIKGASQILAAASEEHGTSHFPSFDVLWYFLSLPQKRSSGVERGIEYVGNFLGLSAGATGILFENELYCTASGRESALSDFGIRLGGRRVVLIVKPKEVLRAGASLERSTIEAYDSVGNPKPFPMRELGIEFSKRMPACLKKYQEECAAYSKRSTASFFDTKLFGLIAPQWSQFGNKKVNASPEDDTIGAGGNDSGKGSKGGNSSGAGTGHHNDGFRPDPSSRKKRVVGKRSGLPPIEEMSITENGSHALRFDCLDTKTFEGATIYVNEAWSGWEEHMRAVAAYGRMLPKKEDVQAKAVRAAKAAIYIGMLAAKKDETALERYTNADALTAVAASIRLQVADRADTEIVQTQA